METPAMRAARILAFRNLIRNERRQFFLGNRLVTVGVGFDMWHQETGCTSAVKRREISGRTLLRSVLPLGLA
jgi:hypothetical protein